MAALVSAEHGETIKNVDPCAQEMLVVGNCRAAFVKWTYNATSGSKFHSHFFGTPCKLLKNNLISKNMLKGKCDQIIWGGCQANTINMFDTEDDCSSKCVNQSVIN